MPIRLKNDLEHQHEATVLREPIDLEVLSVNGQDPSHPSFLRKPDQGGVREVQLAVLVFSEQRDKRR